MQVAADLIVVVAETVGFPVARLVSRSRADSIAPAATTTSSASTLRRQVSRRLADEADAGDPAGAVGDDPLCAGPEQDAEIPGSGRPGEHGVV